MSANRSQSSSLLSREWGYYLITALSRQFGLLLLTLTSLSIYEIPRSRCLTSGAKTTMLPRSGRGPFLTQHDHSTLLLPSQSAKVASPSSHPPAAGDGGGTNPSPISLSGTTTPMQRLTEYARSLGSSSASSFPAFRRESPLSHASTFHTGKHLITTRISSTLRPSYFF